MIMDLIHFYSDGMKDSLTNTCLPRGLVSVSVAAEAEPASCMLYSTHNASVICASSVFVIVILYDKTLNAFHTKCIVLHPKCFTGELRYFKAWLLCFYIKMCK